MTKTIPALFLLALTLAMPTASRAEHEGKIQILLLGDSTTEASIPRKLAPKEAQLEDVIRLLLAAEGDLPPANVINLGLSGEYIRRLLDSGRYDKLVAKLPGLDYVFIRYGLNDVARIKDFDTAFPKDFHELVARRSKLCVIRWTRSSGPCGRAVWDHGSMWPGGLARPWAQKIVEALKTKLPFGPG